MIDYIIIDNDTRYHKLYKEIIDKIMFPQNITYQIHNTNNINDLKKLVNDNNSFKIYLIDICPNTANFGINIAKKIRENDQISEIIFIGPRKIISEPIFNAVRKIYCVIDKISNLKERLLIELNSIINNYNHTNKFFPLDKKGNLQISLDDILYIYRETTERKLYVVTNKIEYPVNLTLADAIKLCDSRFKQVQRACIVNTTKVSIYNWSENYFVLKNGTKVFMCSKKYKDNII